MDDKIKRFNQDFFKSVKGITWYDKEGIMEMDDNRRVVLEIDDVGTRDSYVGYWVKIYNKTNGLIIQKFFRFQHCLEFNHRDREKYYHIWFRDNMEWYISKPKSTQPMVDVIMDFINRWK